VRFKICEFVAEQQDYSEEKNRRTGKGTADNNLTMIPQKWIVIVGCI